MLTVRFPSGISLRYNTATYLVKNDLTWNLYTKKDGDWVASIQTSSGAVVESVPPCEVDDSRFEKIHNRIYDIETQVRGLRRDLKAKKCK